MQLSNLFSKLGTFCFTLGPTTQQRIVIYQLKLAKQKLFLILKVLDFFVIFSVKQQTVKLSV